MSRNIWIPVANDCAQEFQQRRTKAAQLFYTLDTPTHLVELGEQLNPSGHTCNRISYTKAGRPVIRSLDDLADRGATALEYPRLTNVSLTKTHDASGCVYHSELATYGATSKTRCRRRSSGTGQGLVLYLWIHECFPGFPNLQVWMSPSSTS